MKWTREAEQAGVSGATGITLEHVQSCKKRFPTNLEEEVKGHRVETCLGQGGCPNSNFPQSTLSDNVDKLLASRRLRDFLKSRVQDPLKIHKEFVVIADCENAWSRPQIVDVGIIGAVRPASTGEPCSRCDACVTVCSEKAVLLPEDQENPLMNSDKCVSCDQ